jgi:serine/threonine-protein kinase
MELLDGMDLDELVGRFGPLPAERAVLFLQEACRSLAEAHACGLIHRDIKPANLYACRLGGEHDFLKVLDFGMVKGPVGEQSTQLTAAGTATGTPAYMAPEIALGDAEIDGRADLYALGCVAYWLLTGNLVFEGDNPTRMILQHVQETPAPPSTLAEQDVPEALDALVMRCLEKRPADRFPSAGDLRAELLSIEFETPWSEERARTWWSLHVPRAPKWADSAPRSHAPFHATAPAARVSPSERASG